MASKSIIDIPINDDAFQKFLASYNDWSEKLEQMPEAWKKLGASMGEAGLAAGKGMSEGGRTAKEALASNLAQAEMQKKHIEDAVTAQNQFTEATHRSRTSMDALVGGAKKLGSALGGAMGILGKIGEFTGVGAIFGILGDIGLDKLAGGVLQQYRAAGHVGMGLGHYEAFNIAMKQFLGPETLPTAIKSLRTYESLPGMSMLGIDWASANRMSTAELAHREYAAAALAYRNKGSTPFGYTQGGIAAKMLGLDFGDIRIAAMDPIAFEQRWKDYNKLAPQLKIQNPQAWAKLDYTFESNVAKIRNSLINALGNEKFLGVINQLSDELTHFLTSLLSGRDFTAIVNTVADGLQWFANLLITPAFQDGWEKFVDFVGSSTWEAWGKTIQSFGDELAPLVPGLKMVGEEVIALAYKLHWLIDDDDKTDIDRPKLPVPPGFTYDSKSKLWTNKAGDIFDPDFGVAHPKNFGKAVGGLLGTVGQQLEIAGRRALGDYDPARIHALNQLAAEKYGVPLNIMDRLSMAESSNGVNLISSAGALGVYQFMPDVAKGLGFDPLETRPSSEHAAQLLANYYAKYGSWEKAVAAYNAGPGALEKALAHGNDWWSYLLPETQGEVQEVVGKTKSQKLPAELTQAQHGDDALRQHTNRLIKAIHNSQNQGQPIEIHLFSATSANVIKGANAVMNP